MSWPHRPRHSAGMWSWTADAKCAQGWEDVFWDAADGDRDAVAAAKQLCGRCPVREECLEAALRLEQGYEGWGVWGGLEPRERSSLRRRSRRSA